MKRRIITVVVSFMMTIMLILGGLSQEVSANAPKGIYNNGCNGINIDINSAPYTTLAGVPYWGQYAYGPSGCAWFASSRVRQLTGFDCTIFSGRTWYNIQYANYGLERGQTIKARALACYVNHVAVIESFNADGTVTVSEGGYSSVGADYGYTIIHKVSIDEIQSDKSGGFLGYVYLPGSTYLPAGSFTASTTKSSYYKSEKVVVKWGKSSKAVKYRLIIKRTSDAKTVCDSYVTGNSKSLSLPVGNYQVTMKGYTDTNTAGPATTKKYFKVVADPDKSAPKITDVKVSNVSTLGYTVTCTVTDNVGVARVQFPTWTTANKQDDLLANWSKSGAVRGSKKGNTYTFRVKDSDHNYEKGSYMTNIYAYDAQGNYTKVVVKAVTLCNSNLAVNTTTFQTHTYKVYEDNLSWTKAKEKCEALGGHLVTIDSLDEQKVITGVVKTLSRNGYFIGITDRDSEGTYRLVTGAGPTYTNWGVGQPGSKNGNEDYGVLNKSGIWVSSTGEVGNVGFICEWE